MNPSPSEVIATVCFLLAILHTFSVKKLHHIGSKFRPDSVGENFFHLISEIEVVFGIWGAIYLVFYGFMNSFSQAIQFLESRNFTEPGFVFVVMVVCATKPILQVATNLIAAFSRLIPIKDKSLAFYFSCLTVGPLLGSFITEPAAMTVTAIILYQRFYKRSFSQKFMYSTIGLLFVNISIGGTLTPYAAPPVLMVAKAWNWDLAFMISNFGWKAAVAVFISSSIVTLQNRSEICAANRAKLPLEKNEELPLWISVLHISFLTAIVLSSHHLVLFSGIFLFFLGLASVTDEYQDQLKIKEGLLVAFFLGGLVVLGAPQRWWLEPLVGRLDSLTMFLGAAVLTAFTDNAALTYLGAQVPNLSEISKYALLAGAVTGGGLTVIANAPNPAGYGILNSSFGQDGISPWQLFKAALLPTTIAALIFWFL